MTDNDLIARLRDFATREAMEMPPGWPDAHGLYSDAADRIEALVKREEKLGVLLSAAGSVADIQKQRAEAAEARAKRLEEALRVIADGDDWASHDQQIARAALEPAPTAGQRLTAAATEAAAIARGEKEPAAVYVPPAPDAPTPQQVVDAMKDAAAVAMKAREAALREAADYIEHAPVGTRFQDRDAILSLIPKEKPPTEYQQKVAQMKEDFPNGI